MNNQEFALKLRQSQVVDEMGRVMVSQELWEIILQSLATGVPLLGANEKLAQLLRLMQERPDLPIMPMVWEEIVADNASCYWCGSWGHAEITRYWTGEQHVYFYDEEDIGDAINDPDCIYPEMELTEERALEVYRALPWREAIVVYIGMPEEEKDDE